MDTRPALELKGIMLNKRNFMMSKKNAHKYNARKTHCKWANHPHPSGLEAEVCDILALRQKAGDIRNLKWQQTVELDYGLRWKVDWSFEQSPDWHFRLAEAKGKEDATFKHKYRMYTQGCGKWPLEMWRGTWKRPYLDKIVFPKNKMVMILHQEEGKEC